MKAVNTQQIGAYTINLAEIRGNGDFLCPRCGNKLSPSDETEEAYAIETANFNNDFLEGATVICKNCLSRLHLTGFAILRELVYGTQEEAFYFSHI